MRATSTPNEQSIGP